MAALGLEFKDLATILASITQQATGQAVLTPTNTSEFVAVGQTALLTGYDTLSTSISQILSRTIFSVRPYSAKFKGMDVTEQQYGNITRKLSEIDKPFEQDNRFTLVDGSSVDPFTVNKPAVLQENFYGAMTFQKSVTLYRDQLDQAFSSPEEFGRFISMVMQNAADMIEQARENTKRSTLANLIGAIIGNYSAQNIKLVTEFNTRGNFTPPVTWADICANPALYNNFMRFAYSRIAGLSEMLTERSAKYHANITGKTVMRHTPYDKQRMYMLAQHRFDMEAQVLADTFHDNYLKYADVETVNFWQSIDSPDSISVTPSYLDTSTGAIAVGSAVSKTGIFAVIMDEDACGVTQVNEWSDSIWNPSGGYTNMFWHFSQKYWNSFTENALVFTLD